MYGVPVPVLAAIAAVLLLGIFLLIMFKVMWRVAEPNEALIISGRKTKQATEGTEESLTFRIITGGGAMVIPLLQTARQLQLNLNQTDLVVDCVTKQGIQVHLKGSVIFKIGDSFPEIANAARRFLGQQDQMVLQVHSIFSGHVREIVGSMTVEQLISERETLRGAVRQASGSEMEKLGLKIDSLQLLDIKDEDGYILAIGAPFKAAVLSLARIAEADRDREAAEAEAAASILTARARKEASTQQAAFDAEVQEANAKSAQAGPLAEATARQEVVVQETHIATLEAERAAQRLEATVRKPADAAAYQTKVDAEAARDAAISGAEAEAKKIELAAAAQANSTKITAAAQAEATRISGQAEADATQAKGMAEGKAVEAKGLAEAAAIKARGEALAQNQEAVIAQGLAERLPEIVAALAKPFGDADQLVVLNGAEGLNQMLMSVLGQAGAVLPLVRNMMGQGTDSKPDMAVTSPDGALASTDQ